MATKKQKRQAALAKREKFFEVLREDGLRAQQEDRERRKAENAKLLSNITSLPTRKTRAGVKHRAKSTKGE